MSDTTQNPAPAQSVYDRPTQKLWDAAEEILDQLTTAEVYYFAALYLAVGEAVRRRVLFLEDEQGGHKKVLVCQVLSRERVRLEASHTNTLECSVDKLLIFEDRVLTYLVSGEPYTGSQSVDKRCFGVEPDFLRRRGTALPQHDTVEDATPAKTPDAASA